MAIIARAVGLGTVKAADFCRRRFESDLCLAGRVNRELLQQILLLNRNAEYGQRYRFDRITTTESFREQVPLTTYEDYQPYIGRIAAGESGILTSEPVRYFGLTSGTTGKQKMIPMTARAGRLVSEHMGLLPQGILFDAIPGARRLCRGLNIMNMITAGAGGGITAGAGISGGLRSIGRIIPRLWTSPLEALRTPSQRGANYLHLLFALQDPGLMYICSPLSSAVVDLFRLLEQEWPRLVEDLAAGRIEAGVELPPGIRERLERRLGHNPGRARELAAEFEQGFQGVARRIWPHLLYVSCAAGGSFSVYGRRLRRYIGDLPVYSGIYGATEAMIGISLRPGEATYAVTPRTAYHEFIPLSQAGEDRPQVLEMDQLTRGENYEVVITSHAGLYRYRLGDIVKVVDHCYESPVIEFLYRRGQLINLVGEKTSEEAVCRVVYEAMLQWGTELVDFTTMVDYEAYPCRYTFYVEIGHPGRNGADRIEALLENALCRCNPRYHANRQADRLGRAALRVLETGAFDRMKDVLIARGASPNQVKIPRVIRDQELASLLEVNSLYPASDALRAG